MDKSLGGNRHQHCFHKDQIAFCFTTLIDLFKIMQTEYLPKSQKGQSHRNQLALTWQPESIESQRYLVGSTKVKPYLTLR